MSKSLEFCLSVATDSSRSSFADRDWDNAREFDSPEIFDWQLDGERGLTVTGTDENGERFEAHVQLVFDPSADFQYFTSESCKHDGTLLFIKELYDRIVAKVCCLQTWYSKLRQPQSGDNIQITIGNFVRLNEYGADIAPEDKPWMQERTTILLPLRFEYR